MYTVLELCSGAGGMAIGLSRRGFFNVAHIDINPICCQTLLMNSPWATVFNKDIRDIHYRPYRGVDLLAGGLPCPPFSTTGKQKGAADERDLFPTMINIARITRPRAIMIENVPGLLQPRFAEHRHKITSELAKQGFITTWHLLCALKFGVPQRRWRVLMIALRKPHQFIWPRVSPVPTSIGLLLEDMMAARGWDKAAEWAKRAHGYCPTLVGGSANSGGPRLYLPDSKKAWSSLGIDPKSIANLAPDPGFRGKPRLTMAMCARLQGFPDLWQFAGNKTSVWRQIGNAFPPPMAAYAAGEIARSFAG